MGDVTCDGNVDAALFQNDEAYFFIAYLHSMQRIFLSFQHLVLTDCEGSGIVQVFRQNSVSTLAVIVQNNKAAFMLVRIPFL